MTGPTNSQLRWPRQLFVDEARLLLDSVVDGDLEDAAHLLTEAFVDTAPVDGLKKQNDWRFLRQLVDASDEIPEATIGQQRSFSQRRHDNDQPALSTELAARQFVSFVEELVDNGYLARSWGKFCPDDASSRERDPRVEIEVRIGRSDIWPLWRTVENWDEDTLLDLVELFDELVARPRRRWWHAWNECGWHWSEYSTVAGQRLYRWWINRLLGQTELGYELATDGEDAGRLVATVPDARADLVEAMARTTSSAGDQVRHAVALFRARDASEQDKRSAVIALAGVLEERRILLQESLFRRDERSLFQIANEYGLRHQQEGQKSDYDPAFLDWVFWWYLATIELTDRVLARQGAGRAADQSGQDE